jgi:hypothetical protein
VPIGKQDHGGVPITVAAEASCGGDQPVDFRWRQVFPATPIDVGDLRRRVHGEQLSLKRCLA